MRVQHSREMQVSGGGFGNGVHYQALTRRDNKDASTEVLEDSDKALRGRSQNLKSLDYLGKLLPIRCYSCHFLTASPSRLLVFTLIFISALVLVVFRSQGENALFCKEVLSEGEIPYPVVDFQHVKERKDKGKHRSLIAENWIVVFVARDPTDEVKVLAKLKGWQVLAIADSETTKEWSVPGVIFLTMEHQASLGYRLNRYLPYNSFIRKNIGYLYAIQHGARKIYDVDEKQSFLGNDLAIFFDVDLNITQKYCLQYRMVKNRTTVNHFIHFGQRSVWPRGLPLSSIPKISADIFYNEIHTGKQYIQQGLTKGLPDVDSIFYYTRKIEGQPINLEFDSYAPPVALPHGTMAPVNSMNTLFHYQAFWGLMLPVSTGIYASDTVRGYWSQRLLWEIEGMLAMYPPSMFRVDSMQPAMYEDDELYLKNWEELVDFLVSWKSNKPNFFDIILDLSHTMGQRGFWSAQDVELSAAWLYDLLSVGYVQPVLKALDPGKLVPFEAVPSLKQFKPHVFPAKYVGVQEASVVDKDMGNLLRWRRFYGNMVLIMECSWPLNHTVLGFRLVYGRIFKHVVVLSQQADLSLGVEDGAGWQTYKALPGIFERFPEAEGYLILSDHAVLNYWNLLGANTSKLWSLHEDKGLWRVISYNDTGPAWYLHNRIKKSVRKATSSLSESFKANYKETMDDEHFVVCDVPISYIPQRYTSNFVELVKLGVKAKLGHQLALPLFSLALDRPVTYDAEAFRKVCNGGESAEQASAALYSSDCQLTYKTSSISDDELLKTLKAMSLSDPLLSAML